jgi:hypothetical protein
MGEWAPPSFFTQLSCKGVVSQDFRLHKIRKGLIHTKGWASEDILYSPPKGWKFGGLLGLKFPAIQKNISSKSHPRVR